jgi:hypothetical protein
MKIVIVPSTLRAGAKRCMTVAREANASALRLGGLPTPDGVPATATGQLRSAMAQLQRSCAAAERESQFLAARAERGLLADGPFGALIDVTSPPLLSPWAMPAAPPKKREHHWYGGPREFLEGAADESTDTIKGLVDTGAGLAGHAIDGDLGPLGPLLQAAGGPRLSDHIPYIGAKRKELDAAAAWAYRHPGEFAGAVGKDLVAYDDHAKGDNAHGFGRNAVGLLSMLAPLSKAGAVGTTTKAARTARNAERAAGDARGVALAAQRAAYVDHVRATVRRDGESEEAYDLRRVQARNELTRTTGQSHMAEERLRTDVQEAREAAERAAEARREALKETAAVPRDAGAKVLGNRDEAEQ